MKVYSSIALVTDDEKLIETATRVKASEGLCIEFLSPEDVDCIPANAELVIIDDALVSELDVSCAVVVRARDKETVRKLMEIGYVDFLFSSSGDLQFLAACLYRSPKGGEPEETITIGDLRVNTETWKATLRGEAVYLPKSAIYYIQHVYIEGKEPTSTDRVARCRLKKRFGEDLLRPTLKGVRSCQ